VLLLQDEAGLAGVDLFAIFGEESETRGVLILGESRKTCEGMPSTRGVSRSVAGLLDCPCAVFHGLRGRLSGWEEPLELLELSTLQYTPFNYFLPGQNRKAALMAQFFGFR